MGENEQEIRELIQGWATAVHGGDLEGVLADHAEDIVMFDVPPPDEGVRGLDAYSRTWPPFFKWQQSGASFEMLSLKSKPVKTWPFVGSAALRDRRRTPPGSSQPFAPDTRSFEKIAEGGSSPTSIIRFQPS